MVTTSVVPLNSVLVGSFIPTPSVAQYLDIQGMWVLGLFPGFSRQSITFCPERQERLWQILADDIPEQIAGGGTAAWRDTAVVDQKGADGAQQGIDKQL